MTTVCRTWLLLILLVVLYGLIEVPLAERMHQRAMAEKLGILPSTPALRLLSADQKTFAGAAIIIKVLMYFGGNTEKAPTGEAARVDYPAMSRAIHSALQLDPYNMDGYYFAQAIFVWDARKVEVANELLEYGMRYRTWDWYLPFFAGFNYAYFVKDYTKAAHMYRRAGELSGEPLFMKLAGRYLQQSGQTEMAIAYLSTMVKGTRNQAVKESFKVRLTAYQRVRIIEKAVEACKNASGKPPESIEELMKKGFLNKIPADPYGGTFYLNPDGTVATTSKFAFIGRTEQ